MLLVPEYELKIKQDLGPSLFSRAATKWWLSACWGIRQPEYIELHTYPMGCREAHLVALQHPLLGHDGRLHATAHDEQQHLIGQSRCTAAAAGPTTAPASQQLNFGGRSAVDSVGRLSLQDTGRLAGTHD